MSRRYEHNCSAAASNLSSYYTKHSIQRITPSPTVSYKRIFYVLLGYGKFIIAQTPNPVRRPHTSTN